MAVEIRVNPSYIGLQNNSDCVYKWSWYVWDPNTTTAYQATDKVRETTGATPDTTPLTIIHKYFKEFQTFSNMIQI